MIEVFCDRCGGRLTIQGALCFGPPSHKMSKEYHLCVGCWDIIAPAITSDKEAVPPAVECE